MMTLQQPCHIPDDESALPEIGIGDIRYDRIAGRSGVIPLRRYLPAGRTLGAQPAILFFHGAGGASGDLGSCDDFCRQMVRLTGQQLIAVDYRDAPELLFPAAVEDAIDSYAMVMMRAAEWDIDARAIAVMGDGTGGTLASVVSIHARDMCLPIPTAQILFDPVTDVAAETPSLRSGAARDEPEITPVLRWMHHVYAPDDTQPDEWRASPLRVRSLASMPPTFIAVGDGDPLHDEAVAFAARLYKAGVTVELRISIGSLVGEAAQSLEAAAKFLGAVVTPVLPDARRSKA